MKRINGVLQPESFRDAFCRWIIHTPALRCGLCRERFLEPDKAIPILSARAGAAKAQRWRAYKRHIAMAHAGSWEFKSKRA